MCLLLFVDLSLEKYLFKSFWMIDLCDLLLLIKSCLIFSRKKSFIRYIIGKCFSDLWIDFHFFNIAISKKSLPNSSLWRFIPIVSPMTFTVLAYIWVHEIFWVNFCVWCEDRIYLPDFSCGNPGLPPQCTASFIINIPHQSGMFGILDKPTLIDHYHQKSIVHIRVHFWYWTFYGFWQMHNDRYPPL